MHNMLSKTVWLCDTDNFTGSSQWCVQREISKSYIFEENMPESMKIHWPKLTHPSNQPPIHPPIGGGLSTNHKSSNRIELSQLGQDLFDI